jgi:ribonuclease P protein component
VDRNRIKRRLREIFRLRRASFGDCDIVLNPRKSLLKASPADIERALGKVMERSKQ